MNDISARYAFAVVGFDREAVVSDLCDMVSIRSENPFDGPPRPGYRENELGEFLLARLTDLNFEVGSREVAPGRPNVWGRLEARSKGPSLMLAGHMDTVGTGSYDNPFAPRVEHGRVYGHGSCDMKAGLAAYLEVARLLAKSGIQLGGDLLIAGTADEEWRLAGSRDMGRKGPGADFGIIGESEPLTEVAPLDVPVESPLAQATVRAFEAVVGEPAIVRAHAAATDAPNPGFPTIIFRPGSLEQAHSLCEFVEMNEIEIAAKTYLRVAMELLGRVTW